jgi:hypothetical protein
MKNKMEQEEGYMNTDGISDVRHKPEIIHVMKLKIN